MTTAAWSTSNSVYGGRPREPGPRRPFGADVGTGRPWPSQNSLLLAPRVPNTWFIQPSAQQRPASRDAMFAHMRQLEAKEVSRRIMPSSQRDAARAYSAMLHSTFLSAPASMRTWAHDRWPSFAESIKAVKPAFMVALTAAPALISARAQRS